MRKIKIMICSDTDYDQLIAEMYVDDKYIGLISQERGPNNLVVEFPGPDQYEAVITREVEIEILLEALSKAKKELIG